MTDEIRDSIQRYYDVFFGIGALYDQLAKTLGITSSTMFVICTIYECPGECTQSFICNKLFYPKQTVNAILDVFEKQGYIIKVASHNDKRSKKIILTDEGQKYAFRLTSIIQRIEEEAFTNMHPDVRRWLLMSECEFFKQLSSSMDKFIETALPL